MRKYSPQLSGATTLWSWPGTRTAPGAVQGQAMHGQEATRMQTSRPLSSMLMERSSGDGRYSEDHTLGIRGWILSSITRVPGGYTLSDPTRSTGRVRPHFSPGVRSPQVMTSRVHLDSSAFRNLRSFSCHNRFKTYADLDKRRVSFH